MRRITAAGVRRRLELVRRGAAGLAIEQSEHVDDVYAAGLTSWLERRDLRIGSTIAEQWRRRAETWSGSRIAVVVHVDGQRAFDALEPALALLPVDHDLLVTTTADAPVIVPEAPGRRAVFSESVVRQGRDVLPLIHFVNAGMLARHDLVLKLTGGEGAAEGLLSHPDEVRALLSTFASDPSLGIAAPPSRVAGAESWGRNRLLAASLLHRIQLTPDEDGLAFPSGGSYWMRGFVARSLRALQLSEWDFEDEFGQDDETTAFALERVIGILAQESGYEVRETASRGSEDDDGAAEVWRHYEPGGRRDARARVYAIFDVTMSRRYDEAEDSRRPGWPSIAASRPSIRSQIQPKLPESLGFYDPTDDEIARSQSLLAADAAVEGFTYDYRLDAAGSISNDLVRSHIADSGDRGYCLHWGRRDLERHTLRSEVAREGLRLVAETADLLAGERCLRIDGRPVLLASGLDRIAKLPDLLAQWRDDAGTSGLPAPYVVAVADDEWSPETDATVRAAGADAIVDRAQPHTFSGRQTPEAFTVDERFRGEIRDYAGLLRRAVRVLADSDGHRLPSVIVDHDDTPARGIKATVVLGANPLTFRRWFELAVGTVADREPEERVVFIDAWNSWRTGAVLEPSRRFGDNYLDAVRDVVVR